MKTMRVNGRKWRVSRFRHGWTAHADYSTQWGLAHYGIAAPTLHLLRSAMHEFLYRRKVGNELPRNH